jgi:hypothetical protein
MADPQVLLYPLLRKQDYRQIIGDIASGVATGLMQAAALGGFAETSNAVLSGEAVSLFGGLGLVAAIPGMFMWGASIRAGISERDEQIHETMSIILLASLGDAVQRHAKIFPNSKILDPSGIIGLRTDITGAQYSAASKLFAGIHEERWSNMEAEMYQVRLSAVKTYTVYDGEVMDTWREYILSNFDQTRLRYSQALVLMEGEAGR